MFKGLNQNIIITDGEFAKLKNVSDRHFPVISSRPNRGALDKKFNAPKGIFYKNGLFYIDETKAFYKDEEKFTVSDSDKIIVGMGAYICIFPDKVMFNTNDGTLSQMEATYTQDKAITFAPLSEGSAFTKITATGINEKFSKNDNIKISGCTNTKYNATKIINDIGTDYIVVTGALTESFTQDSGLKFERLVPDMDFVAERDNRLWGCSSANHEVYCCKIGDPKNWYNYEAEADNAWAATVGSDGDFTGCTKYSTYMMFFKENTVHILRGDKPANFALAEKELPGVRKGCSKSIQIIDDTLYYVGRNGVYAFDGAIPQLISTNIIQSITDAVACQHDSKLYISCKLDGTQTLLVYDHRYGIWDVEDDTTFKYAAFSEGTLHYVDADNNLTSIYGNRDEHIDWYIESGDILENSLDQKYVSKLKINISLNVGSEVKVFMKVDDEPMWHRKGYIRSTANKTYTIPIIPQRCSKYRYRLEGTGEFKLIGISRDIETGSEINGSIQRSFRR